MPQVNQNVAEFSLRDDMCSYYRGTYVTHEGKCAYVHGFSGRDQKMIAEINIIDTDGRQLDMKAVPVSSLDLHLPRLGWVMYENMWFHLSRNPQRRMRKGYSDEMVRFLNPDGQFGHCSVTETSVLTQIWYGNEDRISHDCIILGRNIHYHQDVVATIDAEGNIIPAIGKEKLGEFVCKLLASNWDTLALKHSLRLPS